MIKWYKLNPDHSIEPAPLREDKGMPTDEYYKWFENFYESRFVAREDVGEHTVSTVFLGLDHGYSEDGPPVLFETLVWKADGSEDMYRYSTYDEAIEGHRRVCRELDSGLTREQLEVSKALIEPLLKE